MMGDGSKEKNKAGNLENHTFLLLNNLLIHAIKSAVLQGFFRPPSNH